jgi:NAD(P)-dependent dehydrogenase (short-subunit alcohol dehydrogenase family)
VDLGWDITAVGRKKLDLTKPETWTWPGMGRYDLLVFSAGEVRPAPWTIKKLEDLEASYRLHAAGPVAFLAKHGNEVLGWWSKVVFISTVGAINSGAVDLGYGMAKAALEKAVKALQEHASWGITMMRFDLVDTDLIRVLPMDSLHGRPILSPEEAAEQIVMAAKLEE